ncbi:Prostaglandin E synthase 2 [Phytophthora boehmeriae]|uniref:Prostaglandin E synthase 2 n=1 Tax=Phytophthora boehmeriae TaxID=109152 RepID=A0A8T1VTN7_9STRA|nr:Prostaglandin E synthase 2 [Phytophthora boehmeriae]
MLQRGVARVARGLRASPASLERSTLAKSIASTNARFVSSRARPASLSGSPLLQKAGLAAAAVSTSAACAFCSAPAVESVAVAKSDGKALPSVVLYQYEPCPYCCKVKAVLDYLKIPYQVVEVNPLTKKETKAFTDYRKVPVCRIDDEVVVDSSAIISRLREVSVASKTNKESEDALAEEQQWREWVDKKLIILTPPNIYRTVPEALQAFDYCLTEGKFTPMERRMSKYAGAVIMYLIAKRSKKKYGIEDERQALYSALDSWVDAVGDNRPFLGGDEPNMADLSVFGVLRAMNGLDTYNDMMRETSIEPWFTRMTAKVGPSSRTVSD